MFIRYFCFLLFMLYNFRKIPWKSGFRTPKLDFRKKWDGFPDSFHDHGGIILKIYGYVLILSSKRGLDFRETACKKSFPAKMFVLFGFQMSFPNFFLSGNRLFPSFPFIINYIEIGQNNNATHSCRAYDTVVAHLRFIVVLRWICPRVSFPGTCCI